MRYLDLYDFYSSMNFIISNFTNQKKSIFNCYRNTLFACIDQKSHATKSDIIMVTSGIIEMYEQS